MASQRCVPVWAVSWMYSEMLEFSSAIIMEIPSSLLPVSCLPLCNAAQFCYILFHSVHGIKWMLSHSLSIVHCALTCDRVSTATIINAYTQATMNVNSLQLQPCVRCNRIHKLLFEATHKEYSMNSLLMCVCHSDCVSVCVFDVWRVWECVQSWANGKHKWLSKVPNTLCHAHVSFGSVVCPVRTEPRLQIVCHRCVRVQLTMAT